MQFSHWIAAVDTHTEGEPTRIITSGIPPLRGATMLLRLDDFRERLDHIRTALIAEPRGHQDMYGCLLTQPTTPEAAHGVFYMHNEGYMTMCGHATIGVSTALVELGMVPVEEPITRFVLDTPAGLVESSVRVKDGRAESVSFQNVLAYAESLDVPLFVPDIGTVTVDIAYGGNWFAFFNAEEVGLELTLGNIGKVVDTGMRIMRAANEQLSVQHPEVPMSNRINIVTAVAPPNDRGRTYRNVHVFGHGQFDRSPGGTGTCARMAVLHAKGRLAVDADVWVESVTEGVFRGRILEATTLQGRQAVLPEITGSAHITGFHQFVIDPDDRLKAGFPTGRV